MGEQATLIDVPAFNGNDDENQRFTLEPAMAWVKRTAGVTAFDLDVAACEESHHAPVWFDKAADGLKQEWRGRVFCNPPWDDIGPWVVKAHHEFYVRRDLLCIAMLLPGGRTHRPWWQKDVEPPRDLADGMGFVEFATHNPPERFSYGAPGNPRGIGCVEPNFTSVLLVWRRA